MKINWRRSRVKGIGNGRGGRKSIRKGGRTDGYRDGGIEETLGHNSAHNRGKQTKSYNISVNNLFNLDQQLYKFNSKSLFSQRTKR